MTVKFLFHSLTHSAAIDAADYEPNEYPPRAEEGDDAVKKMVRTFITFDVCHMLCVSKGRKRKGGGRGVVVCVCACVCVCVCVCV